MNSQAREEEADLPLPTPQGLKMSSQGHKPLERGRREFSPRPHKGSKMNNQGHKPLGSGRRR
jgi:hypothetical protein